MGGEEAGQGRGHFVLRHRSPLVVKGGGGEMEVTWQRFEVPEVVNQCALLHTGRTVRPTAWASIETLGCA